MRMRSFVTAVVIVSFATVLTTQTARAADGPSTATPGHVNLQHAIARAVEKDAQASTRSGALRADRGHQVAMQQGYGGGHTMMVLSLDGMLAGAGIEDYL